MEPGWVVTEEIGDLKVSKTLTEVRFHTIQVWNKQSRPNNWYASEAVFDEDKPSKIMLNPLSYYTKTESGKSYIDSLNTKCYIKVPENGKLSLTKYYFNISAVTIPFIVRLGLNDSISSRVSTDINLGVAISYNIDRVTFRNRRIKGRTGNFGVSFGGAFGFTKITLDKSTTSLAEKPVTDSEAGLGLLLAPGIGFNFRGVRMVAHVGWEIGLTRNTASWNYRGRLLFGLGLGVNILTLGKVVK